MVWKFEFYFFYFYVLFMKMAEIIVHLAGNTYATRGYNPTGNSESDLRIEVVSV